MLSKIREIITKANPAYKIIYEENHMMNVKADELKLTDSFVHIEEFTRGRIFTEGYRKKKSKQMQIYFSKLTEHENDADEREQLRELIENEIVYPFIDAYSNSKFFDEVENWDILYPPPRWDANEVSVMLYFTCKLNLC